MARKSKRPGPLREWPLSHFLPHDTGTRSNVSKLGLKRSLSPSASQLLSPTKRRILREEQLLPSSESSLSPSRRGSRSSDALETMKTCRRLDFEGTTSSVSSSMQNSAYYSDSIFSQTYPVAGPSRRLASSPELDASNSTDSLESCTVGESAFSRTPRTSFYSTTPTLAPREMPLPSDPQSIHYPGFDIHLDRHIENPPISWNSVEKGSECVEDKKENIPPKRRGKRTITLSMLDELKCDKETNDIPSISGMIIEVNDHLPTRPPSTPRRSSRHESVTPRARLSTQINPVGTGFTPGRTPSAGNDRLTRRRLLEREVDEACEEDEAEIDEV